MAVGLVSGGVVPDEAEPEGGLHQLFQGLITRLSGSALFFPPLPRFRFVLVEPGAQVLVRLAVYLW